MSGRTAHCLPYIWRRACDITMGSESASRSAVPLMPFPARSALRAATAAGVNPVREPAAAAAAAVELVWKLISSVVYRRGRGVSGLNLAVPEIRVWKGVDSVWGTTERGIGDQQPIQQSIGRGTWKVAAPFTLDGNVEERGARRLSLCLGSLHHCDFMIRGSLGLQ